VSGLSDLAGVVDKARRAEGGRLVLKCGPLVLEALAKLDGPEWIPPLNIPGEGVGVSYRAVEVYSPDPDLAAGGWRLLEDGEPLGEGTL
jgi:hypothetical protein